MGLLGMLGVLGILGILGVLGILGILSTQRVLEILRVPETLAFTTRWNSGTFRYSARISLKPILTCTQN
ncbi:MAG: hypothetical protein DA443_02785 [Bacteroidetes bacterium]|nr:MAG: hypothetical protein DA443_02785 [Bacteroidota bacterium]